MEMKKRNLDFTFKYLLIVNFIIYHFVLLTLQT